MKATLLQRARYLRRNPTLPEKRLWARLRCKQLHGLKFRRQHILKPFIVDFYHAPNKLVVEVDGPYHQCEPQRIKDARRDEFLADLYQVKILRFSAQSIFTDLEWVLERILEGCRA